MTRIGGRVAQGRAGQTEGGFTLIELMLAIVLLTAMMGMIYASLQIGIRAWDAGEARVAAASQWRMAERFLRREWGQLFATRWRGGTQATVAFEGLKTEIKYVTALNLDAQARAGGLNWARLWLADDGSLMLNRQTFDPQAQNWDSLVDPSREAVESGQVSPSVRLAEGVRSLEIDYYGGDNDVTEAVWREEWRDSQRLPLLIRLRVETVRGRDVPDLVFAPRLGEEAGCLAANFSRFCGPRAR